MFLNTNICLNKTEFNKCMLVFDFKSNEIYLSFSNICLYFVILRKKTKTILIG